MPNTYVALRTETVTGSAASSVTLSLSGISGYTDLVVVSSVKNNSGGNRALFFRFNGDTTTNYSYTELDGNGSTAVSGRSSNSTFGLTGNASNTNFSTGITQIMNYANATTFKTILTRSAEASVGAKAVVNLWRKTPEAITSIQFFLNSDNIDIGSTFSLYGIANADQGAAKATGGIITEDSQYWYHTFGASGVFTPKQGLTCDYLVVAGGGGGYNAGGGAGGLRSTVTATGGGGTLETPLSLLASTNYTVTIGAGGPNGNNGVNSTFATITATGGGAGSGGGFNAAVGGSGGGGATNGSINGANGTTNQGYAGGNGTGSGNNYGGGGGGAGSVGGNVTGTIGGSGGSGVTISALATTTGTGINGAYAGGGGGSYNGGTGGSASAGGGAGQGSAINANNGVANTGGGAGATVGAVSYGVGGSGVVIVRYAK